MKSSMHLISELEGLEDCQVNHRFVLVTQEVLVNKILWVRDRSEMFVDSLVKAEEALDCDFIFSEGDTYLFRRRH